MSMNIRARIFARKITLIYFYEQLFVQEAGANQMMISEIDKVTKVVAPHPDEDAEIKRIEEEVKNYYSNVDQEISYIIENHFSKVDTTDIDFLYIEKVAPHFNEYIERTAKAVNNHAISFKFDDMDMMDRVIFVLGYVEYDLMDTPKEVLLNEMVELGKRYGDDASPKLLNGIGHKVLAEIDLAKK